ncbi:Lsr2 family DNA-binding protein [Streptomyces bobili]
MFSDWQQALEAEALPLRPSTEQELAAACRALARGAHGKDDLAELLDAIGAPTDDDTLTTLLPLLPDTATNGESMTTQTPQTANAFTAVAASMLTSGDSPDQVRTTLGLSEDELADALKEAQTAPVQDTNTTSRDCAQTHAPATTTLRPAAPAGEGGIEVLLVWGEQHAAKSVQALAAKVRTALAELATRRDAELAVTQAEGRVGRLERELARAKEELRRAKTGKPVPAAPAAAGATRAALPSQADNATIRAWARTQGHAVSDHGIIARSIREAYAAAHPTTAEAVH